MGQHRYFVQVQEKNNRLSVVQEVDPKLFAWLQQLTPMDATLNEPNLLQLERYKHLGLFQIVGETQGFYAGIGKMSDGSLLPIYHYFLFVRSTKLISKKKKPYFIADLEAINRQKTLKGDT